MNELEHLRAVVKSIKENGFHPIPFNEDDFDEIIAPEAIATLGQNNLSNEQIAHYLNINTSTLSKWRRGISKPRGSSIRLLQIAVDKPEVVTQYQGSYQENSKMTA